jgi:hypothetical protein
MNKFFRLLKNVYLDIRFGGKFLGGMIKTKYESIGAYDTGNSDYNALNYIFTNMLHIQRDDVIVDVGCGKGRVINFLLHKGLKNKLLFILSV